MTDAAPAYLLIHPDASITWHPLSDEAEVERIVGGHYTATSGGHLGNGGRLRDDSVLRLRAADLQTPEHYEANPLAQKLITRLSNGLVTQPWRGVVALVEYDRHPPTGEVGFPQEMSREWRDKLETQIALAKGEQ